jgi:hypothetical protein
MAKAKEDLPARFYIATSDVKRNIVRTDDLESRRCVIVPIVNSWQLDGSAFPDVSLASSGHRHRRAV